MPSARSARGRKANELCRGLGLEIGALHDPFELEGTVIYLDRCDDTKLKEIYREDPRGSMVKPVTLVAESIPYLFIADGALDFVVNSHVLEHFPNPGMAIEEWMRILRPGGILYSVIPNKYMTFDRPRDVTPLSALMDAYKGKDPIAPLAQYMDYYLNKEIPVGQERHSEEYIVEKFKIQESIHVYTFTPESCEQFLSRLAPMIGFDIIWLDHFDIDIAFALKKRVCANAM